jgi:hypothetical protein
VRQESFNVARDRCVVRADIAKNCWANPRQKIEEHILELPVAERTLCRARDRVKVIDQDVFDRRIGAPESRSELTYSAEHIQHKMCIHASSGISRREAVLKPCTVNRNTPEIPIRLGKSEHFRAGPEHRLA